jgi:hypothetical protein
LLLLSTHTRSFHSPLGPARTSHKISRA